MSETQTAERTADGRRRWLSVLARGSVSELEEAWRDLRAGVEFSYLRAPEIGLCLVRGRAGGTGVRFNLGETTISRCAVRLATGEIGIGYVAGRSARHAELVALFDALLQRQGTEAVASLALVDRLGAAERQRRRGLAARVASTRVEFFTMVRGED